MENNKQADKPKESTELYENVLSSAWARLLMYDDASSWQKKRYQNTRRLVILLWFAATFIAIVKTIFDFELTLGSVSGSRVEGALQATLVIVSAVGVGVMAWSIKFANNVSWIEYRTSAEKIRSQIYLFRTQSGEYFAKEKEQQRDRLLATLNEADRRIPEGIGLPTSLLLPHDDKVKQRLASKSADKDSAMTKDDEYFKAMDVNDYIQTRMEKQINWYARRVVDDSRNMERFQMWALAVAGLGTVLGALGYGLEALVALTTAGGVALTMWGNIRMYGATYFIYRQTANDLQDELDRWNALEESKRTPAMQRQLIETAEKIFLRENEEWRKYSIHMQTANEQTLLSNLQLSGVKLPPVSGSEEAMKAAQQELGEIPPDAPHQVTPAPVVDGAKGVEPAAEPLLQPASDTPSNGVVEPTEDAQELDISLRQPTR